MGEEARGEVQTVAPRPEEEVAGALPDAPEEAMREVAAAQGGGEESVETTEKVDGEDEAQTNGISPESKKKNSSGGHSLTPQPFTTKTKPEDSPDRKSSTRRSPRKTPNGSRFATRSASPSRHQPQQNGTTNPSLHPDDPNEPNETPAAEGDEEEEIPPTRFEIFPPIPGLVSAAKRKPGRPPRGGSRRSITYGTPATASRNRRRRSTNTTTRTRTSTDRSPGTALRRTRSKLGEAALVMNASDDEEEEEEVEEEKVAVREAADEDVAVEEEVDGDGVQEMGFDGEEEVEVEGHDEDAEGSEEEEIKYD
ncbi:hypothetical protein KC318_g6871 [Hortaea werneckii]|nr:hypothetical protein KC334_g1475 [Hortaea werneckii]KAI6915516.1 hypothetical protein KC355_g17929 [Hortaea werneckii]KAI7665823.1 hypothetical protein KC318_g6871 [Hortaea werneckii]